MDKKITIAFPNKKIGKYTYTKSTRKDKKLMTIVDGKIVHFGAISMEHYFDKTGLLNKKLNHNDKKRQDNYLSRSAGIKDGKGNLTKDDPTSPNYHSRKILW
tara:strand:+ start:3130 stop:3435 length:306 start_codon:yes stop_codon:yes gene_type:complete